MNDASSKNILIIQTAFIGDTILASHFARAVKEQFPNSKIHFFLRKGNESVIQGLPTIEKTWIWDKSGGKFKNLVKLITELRQIRFDYVFNLHRFTNSGIVTFMMKSKVKVGYRQNPFAFSFSHKVDHLIPHRSQKVPGSFWHEVQRNLQLLEAVVSGFKISENAKDYRPELPLALKHEEKIKNIVQHHPYFVIAPASVWFTKAWSAEKFQELTKKLTAHGHVYFIGAPSDLELCDQIRENHPHTTNLCGKLNLLESAALMKGAQRVFVNDSAPLHLASAVNAKTTAIFCSTVQNFGYTPLAQDSVVVDVGDSLACRPCGLHGHKSCPEKHFNCSKLIDVQKVADTFSL